MRRLNPATLLFPMQDPPAAYAASRALVNLTATPGNFHEVLQCLVEGLKVNRDVARMRTAQVRAVMTASVPF